MALIGYSRGAIFAAMVTTQDPRPAAVVLGAGVYDFFTWRLTIAQVAAVRDVREPDVAAGGAFTSRRATLGTALAGRGNQPFLCSAVPAHANRAADRRDGIDLGRWSAAWSPALGNDRRSNRMSPDLLVVI